MKLSIGIPTYNRGTFLEKNLIRLSKQIHDNNLENEVEINLSNNGSTDNTDSLIRSFIKQNKDLKVSYNKFIANEGPDKNYITTMHMAKGDYSILLGDDDYFIENGLKTVFDLLEKEKDIDVFLSNRIEIDENENVLGYRSFLHKDIHSRVFDFKDENQAGFYFSLCEEVGGCLTFISSIIYKTKIIEELGPYNNCLDGTFYSFWFYLWGKLSKGGKLYYLDDSYIFNTQILNTRAYDNFGQGLKRTLVEFDGFHKAAELFFYDKNYKKCFLDIPKRWKRMTFLSYECIEDRDLYYSRLLPILRSEYNNQDYIDDLSIFLNYKFHFKCFRKLYISFCIMKFHSLIRKLGRLYNRGFKGYT